MSAAVASRTRLRPKIDGAGSRNHLLDGLRGLAALAVGFGHVSAFYNYPLLDGSHLAVDFFFVLSGFVISRAYDSRLTSGFGFNRFLVSRLVRLYPLVLIGSVLGLIKALAALNMNQANALGLNDVFIAFPLSIILVPVTFRVDQIFPLNGPLWSLFYELVVNVAYAIILFKLPMRWMLIPIAASAATLFYGVLFEPLALNIGSAPGGWAFGLARVTFGFCAGMLIARESHSANRRSHLMSLALGPIFLAFAFWPNFSRQGSGLRDAIFVFLVSPGIIFIGSRIEVPRRFMPIFSYFGDLSYPFYVVHFPIVLMVCALGNKLHLLAWVSGVASICIAVVVAAIAERFYDQPVRARLSAMLRLRESAKPQAL